MKVEPRRVTVQKLVADYRDDGEGGVVGYHGRLDIRPPYQREFIYKDKQRNAVIDSVLKGLPSTSCTGPTVGMAATRSSTASSVPYPSRSTWTATFPLTAATSTTCLRTLRTGYWTTS